MTPEAILDHSPLVLTQAQREAYFASGFLAAEGLIPREWLARLNRLSDAFVEESRGVTASNEAFDLGPRHSEAHPQRSRISTRRPVRCRRIGAGRATARSSPPSRPSYSRHSM